MVGEEMMDDPKRMYVRLYQEYSTQPGAIILSDTEVHLRPLPQEQAQEYLTELVREELEKVRTAKETLDLKDKVKQIADLANLNIEGYESQFRAMLHRLQNVG